MFLHFFWCSPSTSGKRHQKKWDLSNENLDDPHPSPGQMCPFWRIYEIPLVLMARNGAHVKMLVFFTKQKWGLKNQNVEIVQQSMGIGRIKSFVDIEFGKHLKLPNRWFLSHPHSHWWLLYIPVWCIAHTSMEGGKCPATCCIHGCYYVLPIFIDSFLHKKNGSSFELIKGNNPLIHKRSSSMFPCPIETTWHF